MIVMQTNGTTPRHRRSLRMKFIIFMGGIVFLSLALLFLWFDNRSEQILMSSLDTHASSLLQQVVSLRQWVSDHGGLYARLQAGENAPSASSNVIVDSEGNRYVLRNPAMVTSQLSAYAGKKGQAQFRITSLQLINPANAPDEFEREALLAFGRTGFDASSKGFSQIRTEQGVSVYRRMIPLRVEASCLDCHRHQGYSVGDIRGGISVSIPMADAVATLRRNRISLAVIGVAILLLTSSALYFVLSRLVLRPIDRLQALAIRIEKGEYDTFADLATGDELEDLARALNQMNDRTKREYEGAVTILAAAIEARDPYTKGHIDRVAEYTFATARELGCSAKSIREWKMGVLLHDIGKIAVSDSVLRKQGVLEDFEMAEIQSHPRTGADIVLASDLLALELPAILYHHEHYDGKGYPAGLVGEAIPLIARIVAVADVFDALTTDRPYRDAMAVPAAIEHIRRESGKQFDPRVVEAFLRAWERGFRDPKAPGA
jgi:HD-GYP domain-containing protein (c-di-GMP phosphodiesterase class II)